MDAEYVQDLFASFGPVSVRRMFSGAGVYADGLMIALIVRDVIYLKADDGTVPAFEREGAEPFSYTTSKGKTGKGKTSEGMPARRVIMSYWRLPERLYDDPDELAQWAREALAVARRSRAKPRAKPAAPTSNKPAARKPAVRSRRKSSPKS